MVRKAAALGGWAVVGVPRFLSAPAGWGGRAPVKEALFLLRTARAN